MRYAPRGPLASFGLSGAGVAVWKMADPPPARRTYRRDVQLLLSPLMFAERTHCTTLCWDLRQQTSGAQYASCPSRASSRANPDTNRPAVGRWCPSSRALRTPRAFTDTKGLYPSLGCPSSRALQCPRAFTDTKGLFPPTRRPFSRALLTTRANPDTNRPAVGPRCPFSRASSRARPAWVAVQPPRSSRLERKPERISCAIVCKKVRVKCRRVTQTDEHATYGPGRPSLRLLQSAVGQNHKLFSLSYGFFSVKGVKKRVHVPRNHRNAAQRRTKLPK